MDAVNITASTTLALDKRTGFPTSNSLQAISLAKGRLISGTNGACFFSSLMIMLNNREAVKTFDTCWTQINLDALFECYANYETARSIGVSSLVELKVLCSHPEAVNRKHYSICTKCSCVRFPVCLGTVRGFNQMLCDALHIPYFKSEDNLDSILDGTTATAIIEHEHQGSRHIWSYIRTGAVAKLPTVECLTEKTRDINCTLAMSSAVPLSYLFEVKRVKQRKNLKPKLGVSMPPAPKKKVKE